MSHHRSKLHGSHHGVEITYMEATIFNSCKFKGNVACNIKNEHDPSMLEGGGKRAVQQQLVVQHSSTES